MLINCVLKSRLLLRQRAVLGAHVPSRVMPTSQRWLMTGGNLKQSSSLNQKSDGWRKEIIIGHYDIAVLDALTDWSVEQHELPGPDMTTK